MVHLERASLHKPDLLKGERGWNKQSTAEESLAFVFTRQESIHKENCEKNNPSYREILVQNRLHTYQLYSMSIYMYMQCTYVYMYVHKLLVLHLRHF